MSIASVAFQSRFLTVSSTSLLLLYLVIPATLLFVALDTFVWQSRWRDQVLPVNPADILFWSIIFNFPHIVSSMVTLVDREYWQFYRRKLIRGMLVIVSGALFINFLVPIFAGREAADQVFLVFFLFFSGYTVWHVLSQQYGIGMMLMRVAPASRLYLLWRWLSTVAGTSLYMLVFGQSLIRDIMIANVSLVEWITDIALILIVLSTLTGLPLLKQSTRWLGTCYGMGNLLILPTSYLMLDLGYGIFVVVIPRFLHDLTAFMIYSVHDHNRNLESCPNRIYRRLRIIPLSPFVLCPLLAIFLANSIECGSILFDTLMGTAHSLPQKCLLDPLPALQFTRDVPGSMALWIQVTFIIGFFHYYVEGFVWKRDSIHRHSVRFS